MLETLIKWLESERAEFEDNAHSSKPDEFNAGYYGAIVNTLDFIQGAETYITFTERNNNA